MQPSDNGSGGCSPVVLDLSPAISAKTLSPNSNGSPTSNLVSGSLSRGGGKEGGVQGASTFRLTDENSNGQHPTLHLSESGAGGQQQLQQRHQPTGIETPETLSPLGGAATAPPTPADRGERSLPGAVRKASNGPAPVNRFGRSGSNPSLSASGTFLLSNATAQLQQQVQQQQQQPTLTYMQLPHQQQHIGSNMFDTGPGTPGGSPPFRAGGPGGSPGLCGPGGSPGVGAGGAQQRRHHTSPSFASRNSLQGTTVTSGMINTTSGAHANSGAGGITDSRRTSVDSMLPQLAPTDVPDLNFWFNDFNSRYECDPEEVLHDGGVGFSTRDPSEVVSMCRELYVRMATIAKEQQLRQQRQGKMEGGRSPRASTTSTTSNHYRIGGTVHSRMVPSTSRSSSTTPSAQHITKTNLEHQQQQTTTTTAVDKAAAGGASWTDGERQSGSNEDEFDHLGSMSVMSVRAYEPTRETQACREGETVDGFQLLNDKYIILGEAGRGAFGRVDLAVGVKTAEEEEQGAPDKMYAIKVIPKSLLKRRYLQVLQRRGQQNDLERSSSGNSLTSPPATAVVRASEPSSALVLSPGCLQGLDDSPESAELMVVGKPTQNAPRRDDGSPDTSPLIRAHHQGTGAFTSPLSVSTTAGNSGSLRGPARSFTISAASSFNDAVGSGSSNAASPNAAGNVSGPPRGAVHKTDGSPLVGNGSFALPPSGSVNSMGSLLGASSRSGCPQTGGLPPPAPHHEQVYPPYKPPQLTTFHKEIAVMKRLHHKNIVPLVEVIDDPAEEKIYMVMPFIGRGAFLQISAQGTTTPLDANILKSYLREVAGALGYLHQRNIVHRDIKPDNLLLGNDNHLYLSDFGVSEMFSEEQPEEEDTEQPSKENTPSKKKQQLVTTCDGTPMFLAPELLALGAGQEGVAGKPLDIWALGMTFFCAAFGHFPFMARTFQEVREALTNFTSVRNLVEAILQEKQEVDEMAFSATREDKPVPRFDSSPFPEVFNLSSTAQPTDVSPTTAQPTDSPPPALNGTSRPKGLDVGSLDPTFKQNVIEAFSDVDLRSSPLLKVKPWTKNDSKKKKKPRKQRDYYQPAEDLIDLLEHMLDKDPERRFTIRQVRKHPFVTGLRRTTSPPPPSVEVGSLPSPSSVPVSKESGSDDDDILGPQDPVGGLSIQLLATHGAADRVNSASTPSVGDDSAADSSIGEISCLYDETELDVDELEMMGAVSMAWGKASPPPAPTRHASPQASLVPSRHTSLVPSRQASTNNTPKTTPPNQSLMPMHMGTGFNSPTKVLTNGGNESGGNLAPAPPSMPQQSMNAASLLPALMHLKGGRRGLRVGSGTVATPSHPRTPVTSSTPGSFSNLGVTAAPMAKSPHPAPRSANVPSPRRVPAGAGAGGQAPISPQQPQSLGPNHVPSSDEPSQPSPRLTQG